MTRVPQNKTQQPKGYDLFLRWQLCQNIGKVFYNTDLSMDQLKEYFEYFQRPDVLPNQIPTIRIK
ncbi:MAG: hypothetical protein AAB815_01445 [Patescibacteria group bacterium]